MLKKIILVTLLVLFILGIPGRIFNLEGDKLLVFKIIKGLIFSLIIFLLLSVEKIGYKYLFNKKLNKSYFVYLALAIGLSMIFFILQINTIKRISETTFLTSFLIVASTLALTFSEEIVFRVYLPKLISSKQSTIISIIISSALFAVLHIVNLFQHTDIWSILNLVIFAFLIGFILSIVFLLTKNIIIPTTLHFLNNLPIAIKSNTIKIENEVKSLDIANETLIQHFISLAMFIILMSPLIILSIYYSQLLYKNKIIEKY